MSKSVPSPLLRGSFVCEYAGEVVSAEAADRRNRRQDELCEPNYVIRVTEEYEGSRVVTIVDPTHVGNIGR